MATLSKRVVQEPSSKQKSIQPSARRTGNKQSQIIKRSTDVHSTSLRNGKNKTVGVNGKVGVGTRNKRNPKRIGLIQKCLGVLGTGIDTVKYLLAAREARLIEEGLKEQKEYTMMRDALINERAIITEMQSKFQTEAERLFSGDIKNIVLELDVSKYKYFDVIKGAMEYQSLEFEKIAPMTYKIYVKESFLSDWRF